MTTVVHDTFQGEIIPDGQRSVHLLLDLHPSGDGRYQLASLPVRGTLYDGKVQADARTHSVEVATLSLARFLSSERADADPPIDCIMHEDTFDALLAAGSGEGIAHDASTIINLHRQLMHLHRAHLEARFDDRAGTAEPTRALYAQFRSMMNVCSFQGLIISGPSQKITGAPRACGLMRSDIFSESLSRALEMTVGAGDRDVTLARANRIAHAAERGMPTPGDCASAIQAMVQTQAFIEGLDALGMTLSPAPEADYAPPLRHASSPRG